MIELAAKAPTMPAQVLLGDTRGHSFGPPISRPVKKPAVSVVTTTTMTKMTASSPSCGSDRSQIRETAGRPT